MAGKDPSTRTPSRPKLPAPRRPSPPNAPSGSTSEPPLVHQRAPPDEPPRAQAIQDYHPTPRVRDYEDEEEVPGHEEEDPSSYADSRQQAETWEEDEEGIDGYPDDRHGDEYDPLNPELSIPQEFLNDFFLVPD